MDSNQLIEHINEEGRAAVAAKLAEYGIPPFVSRTPCIAQFQRPREIMAWVAKHRPRTWVALDACTDHPFVDAYG